MLLTCLLYREQSRMELLLVFLIPPPGGTMLIALMLIHGWCHVRDVLMNVIGPLHAVPTPDGQSGMPCLPSSNNLGEGLLPGSSMYHGLPTWTGCNQH
jgi:hypothetical protein